MPDPVIVFGANAVKHLFNRKGQIVVPREAIGEDELMELALEAGAEDLQTQETAYEITTDPQHFEAVHKAIEEKGIKPTTAEVAFIPTTTVPIDDEKTAQAMLKFVEALEDNDDVQNVYANFDIPEAILEKVSAAVAS